jgi:hypothetical protein
MRQDSNQTKECKIGGDMDLMAKNELKQLLKESLTIVPITKTVPGPTFDWEVLIGLEIHFDGEKITECEV